jgi:hypothetical protein
MNYRIEQLVNSLPPDFETCTNAVQKSIANTIAACLAIWLGSTARSTAAL